ncbi:MAG: glycoside hydrolase family 3 C-terminal domain-containing protein [Bacteroidales bacterium]|nr:glycoside hydrolase family 3 C-terminal domain-containing protein [Bacteroidales bacterium]
MNTFLKSTATILTIGLVAVSCTQKWQEEAKDGYNLVTQKGGQALGYSPSSGVTIISKGGYAFKDLNRNGKLDVYEDWRKDPVVRAKDLASKLTIEEIAGMMLYSGHQAVNGPEITDAQRKFLKEDNLRAVLMTRVSSSADAARWNNNVQAFVEGLGHGVPANNSSDPRHGAQATAEFDAGNGGSISMWPSSLGMAATFDPGLVGEFGRIASKEYRALGIATALSPQIDLATEPRWSRFNGTFGEDPELDIDMARAYVDGFQTSEGDTEIGGGWGFESVNAMIKHWPSGGPEEGGRDAHYSYGKYAVYPGNNFETQIRPFTEGALKLSGKTGMASAVMPYYTISWNQDPSGANAGNSYNKYIITDLLRDTYGFEGVVCTDWNITKDYSHVEGFEGKCWGMETLTESERHFKVIEAGVDQFGGNNEKGPVLDAYNMWIEKYGEESARKRFETSAVRLLLNSFRTGLFENPYLDPAETEKVVGNPEFMAAGYQAQLKSIVMLKNHDNVLPKNNRLKVYIPKYYEAARRGMFGGQAAQGRWVDPVADAMVDKYYEKVDNPKDADFAIVFINAPASGSGYSVEDREKGGNGYVPISLQYEDYTATYARETSIAGGDPLESFTNRSYKGKTVSTPNKSHMQLVRDTRKVMGTKPVITVISISRPMVMSEIEAYSDAILLSFGVQNQAILETVSGSSEPSGLLPMQLPADMKTVEEQFEDVPRDMECHVDSDGHKYDFAFGMNWSGVIDDARVKKYK